MTDINHENMTPLREFVGQCHQALAGSDNEASQLDLIKPALKTLLSHQGWLPPTHAKPRDDRYAQYALYVADDDSLSVVSFVWKPGQWTPVHDHTVWGVIGIYTGIERTEVYEERDGAMIRTRTIDSKPGEVGAVSPSIGDVHRVGNVSDDTAISIHVYGGNIGLIERHVFEDNGTVKDFVSGYEPAPVLLPQR